MDKHFLEFWGNFFLNAAKSQKQMEDVGRWMHQGFKGYDEITALFKRFYGLEKDKGSEAGSDYLDLWKKAETDFKKSFREYLNLFGVVPREEHLALVRKYEELKEKAASQEETIKHLRMLLSDVKGMDHEKVAGQFDHLMEKQSEQFQKLMDGFGEMFTKEAHPDEAEKRGEK